MKRLSKKLGAVTATSMLLLGVSLAASPAAVAALPPGCSIAVTVPWDDNSWVYSSTTVTCTVTRTITVKAAADEKIGPIWNNGAWQDERTAVTTSVRANAKVWCNGHGTDVWRGRGFGTSSGSSQETTSGETSLTC